MSSNLSEVDIFQLWNIAWVNKWLIGGITAVFAVGSIVYVLSLPDYYRAETVLMPAQDDGGSGGLSSLASQFAGLGNFAFSTSTDRSSEALAVLRSRAFTEEFIERHGMLQVLFEDQWDAERGKWIADNPDERPTPWNGYKRLRDMRTIVEDNATGMVTVAIEWTDPALATAWVNDMVAELNALMQREVIAEAVRNRSFIEGQVGSTSVVEMQQVLYRLLENEIQTAMLAHGQDEFAFKVVDPALIPEEKSRPARAVICIFLTLFGGIVAVLTAFMRHAYRQRKAN